MKRATFGSPPGTQKLAQTPPADWRRRSPHTNGSALDQFNQSVRQHDQQRGGLLQPVAQFLQQAIS